MEKKTIEKAPSAEETTHIPTIYQEITPHKHTKWKRRRLKKHQVLKKLHTSPQYTKKLRRIRSVDQHLAYKMEKKTIEKAPSAEETTHIPTIYQEITPHKHTKWKRRRLRKHQVLKKLQTSPQYTKKLRRIRSVDQHLADKMEKKTIEKAPSAEETTHIPTIYQEITPHKVGGSASSIQNGKEDD
ncbi:hypothetical protein T4A_11452 [Trichinella pseudospiralis]|uniref:Uncharacterized protein n=1 Tax=Trichinella pseudospiralis TaxID=6337 RepID=A0A0V1EAM7_TRIPS|nr:hypothetical protein T4A_11452 [Trichinella pseudospiralis]